MALWTLTLPLKVKAGIQWSKSHVTAYVRRFARGVKNAQSPAKNNQKAEKRKNTSGEDVTKILAFMEK